jgi:hypothetical protein
LEKNLCFDCWQIIEEEYIQAQDEEDRINDMIDERCRKEGR